ncbi:MAG: hypothetical protein KDA85_06590, partial [Planctomycetaceae bacterium]|nr:hypothetical protein [Planctomycetaceae bacterium]
GTSTGYDGTDLLNTDPGLQPLLTTGLPAFPLLLTSPAIDAGSSTGIPETDALGRPRLLGAQPDIGAVEAFSLIVTSISDTMTPGSLRFAVTVANQLPGNDRITFDPALNGNPVLVSSGEITISGPLELIGNGAASTILDAQQNSRLFTVTSSAGNVAFDGVTLRNGRTTERNQSGGAIESYTLGELRIENSRLTGHSVTGSGAFGGAFYSEGTGVVIRNSTFDANVTNGGRAGGEVSANDGTLSIENSTFTNNSSNLYGGAIHIRNSTAEIRNSTISGNASTDVGGGLRVIAGSAILSNTVIAGNSGSTTPEISLSSATATLNHSLIGNNSGTSFAAAPVGSPDADGNLIGTPASPIDPNLGPLEENGGNIPTMALLSGSPAVNAGVGQVLDVENNVVFVAPTRDQRGFLRDQDLPDMGAFERQFVQNLSTLPSTDVVITSIDATHQKIVTNYVDNGNPLATELILFTPEIRLNTLPFITADTSADQTIGPQSVLAGSLVGPLSFIVDDLTTAADSLTLQVHSGNSSVIPDSAFALGGSGAHRTLQISVPSEVAGTVPVTLTVGDGDGAVDYTFTIQVIDLTVSNLITRIADGASTASAIDLGPVTSSSPGLNAVVLSGPDAVRFELRQDHLFLKAGIPVNAALQLQFLVTLSPEDSNLSVDYLLTVNAAPTAVTLQNALAGLISSSLPLAASLKIADISVADISDVTTNQLSLTGADLASFELVGNALYLKSGAVLNASSKSVYSVRVLVDDAAVGNAPDAFVDFSLPLTTALPTLTAPGTVTMSLRPAFVWNPVPGAVSYEVWINNQTTGTFPFHREVVSSSEWTPDFDFGIGLYNVWVQAKDALGHKSFWTQQKNVKVNTRATIDAIELQQNTSNPALSWEPLPGAVHYDLWIDNLSTGISQFIRLQNLTGTSWTPSAPMPLGRYAAWLRGIDAKDTPATWSYGIRFSVMTSPQIMSGQNSTFNRTPTFSWTPVPGADHYEVYIRNQNTGAVVYQQGISSTSWQVNSALPDDLYRWWAIAVSAQNFRGLWTNPMDIYVGGRPMLVGPQGATSDTIPTFVWRPVDGVVRYELWVDQIGVKTGLINQTNLTGMSYSPGSPLPTGNYRFWVRAVSSTGEFSPWSLQANFTVVAGASIEDHLPQLTSMNVIEDLVSAPLRLATNVTFTERQPITDAQKPAGTRKPANLLNSGHDRQDANARMEMCFATVDDWIVDSNTPNDTTSQSLMSLPDLAMEDSELIDAVMSLCSSTGFSG